MIVLLPMTFRTFASPKAEAGYYAELDAFGGILSFQDDKCASYSLFAALHSIDEFIVMILTSKNSQDIASIDALKKLKPWALPTASPTPIQETPAMLCDSDDELEEPLFPNRCPRDYLGVKLHPILILPL